MGTDEKIYAHLKDKKRVNPSKVTSVVGFICLFVCFPDSSLSCVYLLVESLFQVLKFLESALFSCKCAHTIN